MTTFQIYDEVQNAILSDCVQLSLVCGRQELLDPWAASSGFARFRVTSANSAYLSNLDPGEKLRVQYLQGGSTITFFYVVILNKVYTYGNKSANNTYEDDYCEVQFEGFYSKLGRTNVPSYTATADTFVNQDTAILTQYNTALNINSTQIGDFSFREYVIAGTLADYSAIVGTTTSSQLDDRQFPSVRPIVKSAQYESPSTLSFSDTTTSSTQLKIEAITFSTIGNNTYDEVIITLNNGPIPVVAIRSGATQPYRILLLDTIWADSNQALDYANWLLWLFQDSNFITSVTFSDATQTSPNYATLFDSIGKEISVTFRGTTYTTVLEGLQFDAVPGDATTTAYLTTGRQVTMFILDSSTRGVLDTNRLGY